MKVPRHSTIVAYAALFAALGGTSYAAVQLKAGSVTAREIRTGAVRSSEIRNGSVQTRDLASTARPASDAHVRALVTDTMTSSDVLSALTTALRGEKGAAGETGPAGPAGPQGTPGLSGLVVREELSGTVGVGQTSALARCAEGETVIGGGGRFDTGGPESTASMVASAPADAPAQGWTVTFSNAGPTQGKAHAFALCARVAS